jgi:BirA family biotin operon repressor/biotin-[acetyl-CoA-carboxylase] ligase
VESAVLGIGVNVLPESVPPDAELNFPATCIHSEGVAVNRLELLHDLLAKLVAMRPQVGQESFIKLWEASLAYMNETVHIWIEPASSLSKESSLTGMVRGLEPDGALRLETPGGIQLIKFGEIHLRPVKIGL